MHPLLEPFKVVLIYLYFLQRYGKLNNDSPKVSGNAWNL